MRTFLKVSDKKAIALDRIESVEWLKGDRLVVRLIGHSTTLDVGPPYQMDLLTTIMPKSGPPGE